MSTSPAAYKTEKRLPVEFPSARFSTFSIPWVGLHKQTEPPPANTGIIPPMTLPTLIEWDFGLVTSEVGASMNWGSILNTPVPPALDFGSIETI